MKASNVIKAMQRRIEVYGDYEVQIRLADDDTDYDLNVVYTDDDAERIIVSNQIDLFPEEL